MLPHFINIYALEDVFVYCIGGCVTTHLVPTLFKWHYIGCLEMAIVGVFTLWKIANIPNQSLFYCFADFLDLRKCYQCWLNLKVCCSYRLNIVSIAQWLRTYSLSICQWLSNSATKLLMSFWHKCPLFHFLGILWSKRK